MANTTPVQSFASLVEGYQHSDPKLYQILQGFVQALGEIQAQLNPVVKQIIDTSNTLGAPANAPTTINYEILNQRILRIYWSWAKNAATYEVRKGTDWNFANYVTSTNQLEVRLDPIPVGTHTYLVKSKNGLGAYSADQISIVVIITPIESMTLTAQVIDNNVLLRYSEPPSVWLIDYYEIFRNNLSLGFVDSTFFVWFETLAGSYTFGVEAVDVIGNRSPRASAQANVKQPPDFELQDARYSLLAGTKVNAIPYGDPPLGWDYTVQGGWPCTDFIWFTANTGKILVCVDLEDTWSLHFTEDGWDQIQDQQAVGYTIYISPNELTAQYQEIIDYGAVFNNTILNLTWLLQNMNAAQGTVTVASLVEFSSDKITWSAPQPGPSVFAQSFRYARLTFNFTANNRKAIAVFSALNILLDVKRDVDSGEVSAISTDVGGTVVTFTKPFKDIDSITLTPTKQVEPLMAIYDFVDVPNPVSFKVFVFNSIGTRVTALVSWKARGIV